MNKPTKSSTLFQDLIALEKDHTYNMTQLKIKEEEIIRFQKTNKTLEEILKTSLNEINVLKYKQRELEESLTNVIQTNAHEKQICEGIIKRLTAKINEVKHNYEEEMEDMCKQTNRKCSELNMECVKKLQDMNVLHKSTMEEIESNLKNEKRKVSDLKHQLNNSIDDNMALRNKIREMETHLIPEMTIYKTELNTAKAENKILATQLSTLRQESEIAGKKLSQTISDAKNESKLRDDQLRANINEKEALIAANKKLSLQLRDCFKSNKELLVRAAGCEDERQQLCAEIGQLAVIAGSRMQCNVPQHAKCNDIYRQNGMLQQTIKRMREEMEELTERRMVENEGAEGRLDNLEKLVAKLKETLQHKYRMDKEN